ncbi:MAG: hypothetical protein ACK5UP_11995, partial [Bacteroidota bacterium]
LVTTDQNGTQIDKLRLVGELGESKADYEPIEDAKIFSESKIVLIELGRLAKINEYALEAFLIWMVPLGVWFIQPRLNELAD